MNAIAATQNTRRHFCLNCKQMAETREFVRKDRSGYTCTVCDRDTFVARDLLGSPN